MNRIKEFYRISRPAPKRELDDTACDRYYRRLRLQAFIAATLGYSLYYVCRTSLNVTNYIKKCGKRVIISENGSC